MKPKKLLQFCLLFAICIYSAGAEQPLPSSPGSDQGIDFRVLPDGVEHWTVKSPTPDALPVFYQLIEKAADVIVGRERLPFRRTIVFLAGVSEYALLKPSLPFVKNDLEDLRNYFIHQGGADEVYVASGRIVSAALIRNYMADFFRTNLRPEDRLIFYFAGHGIDGGGTTGYIQLYNARPNNLAGDVLMISDVREWSRIIPARHVLFIFDSCASGLGVTPRETLGDSRDQIVSTLSEGGSRTVITAGTGNQKTFEVRSATNKARGNGVFTRAFLDALMSGRGYGFLTINEVFADVERRVAVFASEYSQVVSPKRWTLDENEYKGTFIFLNTDSIALKKSLDDFRPYLDAKPRNENGQEEVSTSDLVRSKNLREQGVVAFQRGNLAEASDFMGKAFEIRRRINPSSLAVSESLTDFGKIALEEGAVGEALHYFRQALFIARRNAPRGYHSADALNGIGSAFFQIGRLDEADQAFRESLGIAASISPRSLLVAEVLQNMSRTAVKKGNLREAEDYLKEAFEIVREQVPTSRQETTLHEDAFELFASLGWVERGLLEAEYAIGSFESEFSRAGGSLVDKVRFRSRQHAFVSSYIKLRAEKGQFSSALVLLDELRARVLSEVIMGRSERRRVLPSLRVPAPRSYLEDTTALVAYSVSEDGVLILVDTLEGPSSTFVPIKRDRLWSLVRRLEEDRGLRISLGPEIRVARELYDILVAPVEHRIEYAERLAIITDGPLDFLPFSALVRHGTIDSRRIEYFIEWKPHFKIPSAFVFGELKKRRKEASTYPISLLALAPSYGCGKASSGKTLDLPPLPWAEKEARTISSIFMDSHVYVGESATKEVLLKYAPLSRYIHIGAHGITNSVNPLSSRIVLSSESCERPEEGSLYATEIVEHLNTEADLVTLSSCEAALGVSVPAEGVMGFAWAFLAAGSRSVVASLWKVGDKEAQVLMTKFYSRLQKGEGKLEALRRAQIELLHSKYSPQHWAAFELYGDWR